MGFSSKQAFCCVPAARAALRARRDSPKFSRAGGNVQGWVGQGARAGGGGQGIPWLSRRVGWPAGRIGSSLGCSQSLLRMALLLPAPPPPS